MCLKLRRPSRFATTEQAVATQGYKRQREYERCDYRSVGTGLIGFDLDKCGEQHEPAPQHANSADNTIQHNSPLRPLRTAAR
jgi:hypothetical protein